MTEKLSLGQSSKLFKQMSLHKKTLLHVDVAGFPASLKVSERLKSILEILHAEKLLRLSKVHTLVLSVTALDAASMKALNYKVRRKKGVTDILSFEESGSPMPLGVRFLGDLVVCLPVLKSQAKAQRHALGVELNILFVHGLLHLLGYDHEQSERARQKMQRLEQTILKRLKVSAGLIQRSRL